MSMHTLVQPYCSAITCNILVSGRAKNILIKHYSRTITISWCEKAVNYSHKPAYCAVHKSDTRTFEHIFLIHVHCVQKKTNPLYVSSVRLSLISPIFVLASEIFLALLQDRPDPSKVNFWY